jgi:hypothetical protein
MCTTVGDKLHTLCREKPPQNVVTAIELVNSALASAQYGLCIDVYCTLLGIAPGILMFHQGMLLLVSVLVDYNLIHQRHHTMIDENKCHTNLCHRST